jgi:hypothetical protein
MRSKITIILPDELALQTFKTFLVIISSMSLIHICVTFTIDYGYLCLYAFSWVNSILLRVCVAGTSQRFKISRYQSFQLKISVNTSIECNVLLMCVCVPCTSQCLYSKCYITPFDCITAFLDHNKWMRWVWTQLKP